MHFPRIFYYHITIFSSTFKLAKHANILQVSLIEEIRGVSSCFNPFYKSEPLL